MKGLNKAPAKERNGMMPWKDRNDGHIEQVDPNTWERRKSQREIMCLCRSGTDAWRGADLKEVKPENPKALVHLRRNLK